MTFFSEIQINNIFIKFHFNWYTVNMHIFVAAKLYPANLLGLL
jgi:hypothetical protein